MERRKLLSRVIGVIGGGALLSTAAALTLGPDDSPSDGAQDIAPSEDLMREHGVHRRIILVYREAARRLHTGEPVPAGALGESTALVQRFIHGYHEKLEEKHVLPRVIAANQLLPLISTIQVQHAAGRVLTTRIAELSKADSADGRSRLRDALDAFVRMYEPHAQREDTELIPAYRALLTAAELEQLKDRFEEEEQVALGNDGFEGAVLTVHHVEAAFGLADLAHFTPQLT
jgi:hemerythrin-like domain-containing protein